MRAVRRAERVVDVGLPQSGQLAGKLGVTGFFAGVKPQVLQHQAPAWSEVGGEPFDLEPDAITLDLEMPEMGFLHQLFAGPDWTGDPAAATRLTVIYVPFRTPSDLGLPAGRSNGPWMMLPGEGTAHIMISG